MTNKTELLSCPFCGIDALHYDNGYATCGKYRCPMNGVVVKNEEWNTRAPAEDVRAVVEEPVGYGAWNTGTNPGTRLIRYDGMVAISPEASDFYKVPVYLRPHRPVVLPEREMYTRYLRGVIPENRFEVEAYKDGWNACLDAVEELNK